MMNTTKTPSWYHDNKIKLRPLYLALSASTIVQGIAVYLAVPLAGQAADSLDSGVESMQMLLSVFGMGCCFAATVFNQWSLKPKRVREHPLGANQANHIFMSFLLTWVLAELCATIGLVISVLTKDSSQYAMFGVLALLTILAHPYTEGRVRRVVSR